MGILKRFFGPEDRPIWALALPKGGFEDFCNLVEEGIKNRGWGAETHFDEGYVKITSGPFEGQEIGLDNMCRYVGSLPKVLWKKVIEDFLTNMWQNQEEAAAFENSTWEQAKSLIRPRIFDPVDVPQVDWLTIDERFTTFRVALFADLTHSASSVRTDTVENWGVTPEEAFDQAIENVFAIKPRRQALTGGWHESLSIEEENGLYVHARCLRLERLVTEGVGAVFMIPTRGDLYVIEVKENPDPVQIINAMLNPALDAYMRSPGPVTPRIFWWDRESIVELETSYGEGVPYEIHVTEGEQWRRLKGV